MDAQRTNSTTSAAETSRQVRMPPRPTIGRLLPPSPAVSRRLPSSPTSDVVARGVARTGGDDAPRVQGGGGGAPPHSHRARERRRRVDCPTGGAEGAPQDSRTPRAAARPVGERRGAEAGGARLGECGARACLRRDRAARGGARGRTTRDDGQTRRGGKVRRRGDGGGGRSTGGLGFKTLGGWGSEHRGGVGVGATTFGARGAIVWLATLTLCASLGGVAGAPWRSSALRG